MRIKTVEGPFEKPIVHFEVPRWIITIISSGRSLARTLSTPMSIPLASWTRLFYISGQTNRRTVAVTAWTIEWGVCLLLLRPTSWIGFASVFHTKRCHILDDGHCFFCSPPFCILHAPVAGSRSFSSTPPGLKIEPRNSSCEAGKFTFSDLEVSSELLTRSGPREGASLLLCEESNTGSDQQMKEGVTAKYACFKRTQLKTRITAMAPTMAVS